MKFPKLRLVRNYDVAEVSGYNLYGFRYEEPTSANIFVMAINSTGFLLNLDAFHYKRHLIRFPQIWLHEWLHWFFGTKEVCELIHRISKRTKTLII